MLPSALREYARRLAKEHSPVRLAVLGPGIGSPFFEKREQAASCIKAEFGSANINYQILDRQQDPVASADDWNRRLRLEEIAHLEWAHVILFLFTHHMLTAFTEFQILMDLRFKLSGVDPFAKCGLVILDSLEVSRIWELEAKRLCDGSTGRVRVCSQKDLDACCVASQVCVDLFARVMLERFGRLG